VLNGGTRHIPKRRLGSVCGGGSAPSACIQERLRGPDHYLQARPLWPNPGRSRKVHDRRGVRNNSLIPKIFWWAEGAAALMQNWTTGDFETWVGSGLDKHRLRAFNVLFLRADIQKMIPPGFVPTVSTNTKARSGTNVVIGHGRSPVWRELKDFIKDRLNLQWTSSTACLSRECRLPPDCLRC